MNEHDRDFVLESAGILQELAQVIDRTIKRIFPKRKLGFALFLFDFREEKEGRGHLAYVTSARTQDLPAMLREAAGILEQKGGPDTPPMSLN